jgi:hypothetical protein
MSGGIKFPRNPFSANQQHAGPPDPAPPVHRRPHPDSGVNAPQHQATQTQAPEKPPRRRRTATEIYAIAERNRRLQQRAHNARTQPSKEDIWICLFCEYENIFGTRPEALIRRYEKKDREARKAAAEKRRLLEKAKMKGRKNKKKGGKADKNASAAQHQHGHGHGQAHPPHDDYPDDQHLDPLDGSNDYYEDDYEDEEYDPAPGAPVGGRYPTEAPPPAVGGGAIRTTSRGT